MNHNTEDRSIAGRVLKELDPAQLLPSLTAGLVSGVLTILFAISFAAMIFSGTLSEHLSSGIGLTLMGAFIVGVIVAMTSSYPGAVAIPQESPAAIVALVATAVAAAIPASAGADAAYITVVAVIALTSFLTGAFFFILGILKLSTFIRFIPYPVIGGFLAGTGWLLIQGGIGIITGASLSFDQLPHLVEAPVLLKWLPALIFAFAMLVLLRKFTHFLVMPLMIVVAIILFYAVLFFSNTPIAEALNQGWLLGPFPEGALWKPINMDDLAMVNWPIILGEAGNLGTILIISLISLLLCASGLELSTKQDIDLNHELKSSGMANMAVALVAGPVGYFSLSLSALGHTMGSKSRLIGLTSAFVCGTVLVFGAPILTYFPKPVLGSLVLFIGLAFLAEWVYDAWFRLPRADYFLVLLILLFVASMGFLEGIAAGIFVAGVIFVLEYSRIKVIKHELSGKNYRSNVDRSLAEGRRLIEKGDEIYILKLQGFIFFGTANNLLEKARYKIDKKSQSAVKFVVLDFRLVSGMDASAVSSFMRMKNMAETHDIYLVFTNLSQAMKNQFEKGCILEADNLRVKNYVDIDHAVEWCEDKILFDSRSAAMNQSQANLSEQLKEAFPEKGQFKIFSGYLERKNVTAGFKLLTQGNRPEGIYFIESGRVTVRFEGEDKEAIRLRTMGAGTVVGELGVYLDRPATATVITDLPGTIYLLAVDALKEMEEKDPDTASAFHTFIVRLLAERLVNTNNSLRALLD